MVSKITIFEPHFDGAQFGPTSMEGLTGEETEETESSAEEEGKSKSRLVTFLQGATVFVVMFVVLWTALSRLQSDEDEEEKEVEQTSQRRIPI